MSEVLRDPDSLRQFPISVPSKIKTPIMPKYSNSSPKHSI